VNFLGKLHNTKQHIQFIKFIKDELIIPDDVLGAFLTSYTTCALRSSCEDVSLIPTKIRDIQSQFDNCDWYVFEICSLKLYTKGDFHVQSELTNDYTCSLQTAEELYDDLAVLKSLIPETKRILFQVHFRPNIIYSDATKAIANRELIYDVVQQFCKDHENVFMYDPSQLLQGDRSLYDDDTHFHNTGYVESFNYMYTLMGDIATPFGGDAPP
jgi:hypothetical protein